MAPERAAFNHLFKEQSVGLAYNVIKSKRSREGTVLLEGGMDTRHIQEILGHASLESTQIYTRVSIQKLKALHTAIHPGKMPEVGKH